MSKKKAIKGKSVPTKTTLNLVIKEKSEFRLGRVLPALLVVVAAAAAFSKFAVLDRFAALDAAENVLASERAHLNEVVNSYADFDEVQAEYNRYTYQDFDRTVPDRQDVLQLVERYVFPISGMRQMAISGKSVSMTLTGMTLQQISSLIAKLEADPLVNNVVVSTAGYSDRESDIPTASMVIALADAVPAEGGEG